MGPYCKFCDRRCFLLRVLKDGRSMLLATCPPGMAHDRARVGEDHTTAVNPHTAPREAEDRVLANAAALDPSDNSLPARIVRETAQSIRDHRESAR